jgi:hypothetical protein
LNQVPSSGPSDHLLPQGEKGRGTSAGNFSATEAAEDSELPSPPAGEGARRAGEGA